MGGDQSLSISGGAFSGLARGVGYSSCRRHHGGQPVAGGSAPNSTRRRFLCCICQWCGSARKTCCPIGNPTATNSLFYAFCRSGASVVGRVLGRLSEQIPEAQLLIAGEAFQAGREALYKQAMLQTNPLAAAQVEWLGYVQPATLPQLYAQVACAIFPSSRTPLLEAKCSVKLATTLLSGVPVVATRWASRRRMAPTARPGWSRPRRHLKNLRRRSPPSYNSQRSVKP